MKTTAWLAILASAAPALAMPGLSGFAGTQRGNWKDHGPVIHHPPPLADDTESSAQQSSSSLSELASNPPTTESIWGSRLLAAIQMIATRKDSFSYAPVATAVSDPSPEVANTTVIEVITEYASATPTAVQLAEKTVTIYTTIFEAICTKTDHWMKDGTAFSSLYETVTTSSIIDFYQPNSPTAAPETIHSSFSILTPVRPHGPIHPSGDSISTSTSTFTRKTTVTETDYHTVEPTVVPETSWANPSNYGSIPLTHSTKSSPPTTAAFSLPSAAEHETVPKADSTTLKSYDFSLSLHGGPSKVPAIPASPKSHKQESAAVSIVPSASAYESNTPWHSKATPDVPASLPAVPSAAQPESSNVIFQPSSIAQAPENYSAPLDYRPVTSTWVDQTVSEFTSVYPTVVPQNSIWTLRNSNITRSRTFFANTTMTSVKTSTILATHTSIKTAAIHVPSPLGSKPTGVPGIGNDSIPATRVHPGPFSEASCTEKPKQTDFCIPCEGQPGNDPNNFCGYTVHDDSYKVTPKTCRTVEYNFVVSNVTVAPDGVERIGLVVNGQMPGPLIEANWGDTIIVHLENQLQDNGTSIHFHGMRQLGTNEMDGVPSITQCALAPGEKMTYTFVASNYGSSWYHSHFALQTYDGVFGPMTIHGPSSAEYDIDAGFAVLQDWGHATVNQQYHWAETVGPAPEYGPRTLDTGLINGMNVWRGDNDTGPETGSRFEMTFQPGKTHLIRVVNTAIQSTFKFHIDGHKFTVISADFVPIVPYETDILNINIGQRYNILVKADQEPGDYWMRSDNQQSCAELRNSRDIKGIVHYEGCSGMPTTVSRNYTDECIDEPYEKLVPVVPLYAGAETSEIHKNILVGEGPNTPNLFKWTLDSTTFQSQWGDPTLGGIVFNDTVPPYSGNLAIEVTTKQWVYVIVESPVPLPHPIHLHGHDSLVLAQGTGPYDPSIPLKLDNPPRRDTALMPFNHETGEGGYLVIAFETDNPGAWLMHCHIGWHVSMGFALQIIERKEEIRQTVSDTCQLGGTCKTWNQYAALNHVYPDDSGV